MKKKKKFVSKIKFAKIFLIVAGSVGLGVALVSISVNYKMGDVIQKMDLNPPVMEDRRINFFNQYTIKGKLPDYLYYIYNENTIYLNDKFKTIVYKNKNQFTMEVKVNKYINAVDNLYYIEDNVGYVSIKDGKVIPFSQVRASRWDSIQTISNANDTIGRVDVFGKKIGDEYRVYRVDGIEDKNYKWSAPPKKPEVFRPEEVLELPEEYRNDSVYDNHSMKYGVFSRKFISYLVPQSQLGGESAKYIHKLYIDSDTNKGIKVTADRFLVDKPNELYERIHYNFVFEDNDHYKTANLPQPTFIYRKNTYVDGQFVDEEPDFDQSGTNIYSYSYQYPKVIKNVDWGQDVLKINGEVISVYKAKAEYDIEENMGDLDEVVVETVSVTDFVKTRTILRKKHYDGYFSAKWIGWNPEINADQRKLIQPTLEDGTDRVNPDYNPKIDPETGLETQIYWANDSKMSHNLKSIDNLTANTVKGAFVNVTYSRKGFTVHASRQYKKLSQERLGYGKYWNEQDLQYRIISNPNNYYVNSLAGAWLHVLNIDDRQAPQYTLVYVDKDEANFKKYLDIKKYVPVNKSVYGQLLLQYLNTIKNRKISDLNTLGYTKLLVEWSDFVTNINTLNFDKTKDENGKEIIKISKKVNPPDDTDSVEWNTDKIKDYLDKKNKTNGKNILKDIDTKNKKPIDWVLDIHNKIKENEENKDKLNLDENENDPKNKEPELTQEEIDKKEIHDTKETTKNILSNKKLSDKDIEDIFEQFDKLLDKLPNDESAKILFKNQYLKNPQSLIKTLFTYKPIRVIFYEFVLKNNNLWDDILIKSFLDLIDLSVKNLGISIDSKLFSNYLNAQVDAINQLQKLYSASNLEFNLMHQIKTYDYLNIYSDWYSNNLSILKVLDKNDEEYEFIKQNVNVKQMIIKYQATSKSQIKYFISEKFNSDGWETNLKFNKEGLITEIRSMKNQNYFLIDYDDFVDDEYTLTYERLVLNNQLFLSINVASKKGETIDEGGKFLVESIPLNNEYDFTYKSIFSKIKKLNLNGLKDPILISEMITKHILNDVDELNETDIKWSLINKKIKDLQVVHLSSEKYVEPITVEVYSSNLSKQYYTTFEIENIFYGDEFPTITDLTELDFELLNTNARNKSELIEILYQQLQDKLSQFKIDAKRDLNIEFEKYYPVLSGNFEYIFKITPKQLLYTNSKSFTIKNELAADQRYELDLNDIHFNEIKIETNDGKVLIESVVAKIQEQLDLYQIKYLEDVKIQYLNLPTNILFLIQSKHENTLWLPLIPLNSNIKNQATIKITNKNTTTEEKNENVDYSDLDVIDKIKNKDFSTKTNYLLWLIPTAVVSAISSIIGGKIIYNRFRKRFK